MDLRHFEQFFRSQTLQQAIRWLKNNQVRKLPQEYGVGEARVRIKTNANILLQASCSCKRAKCVHLAAVLLHRQGAVEHGLLLAKTPVSIFQKSLSKIRRQIATGKMISLAHQITLSDKLAWLCVCHAEEKWVEDNQRLVEVLRNVAAREVDDAVWRDTALQLIKSSMLYSGLTNRLFPICVQHLKRDGSLEEIAESLRTLKQRRHPEVRRFLQEVLIQKRISLSGIPPRPESAMAAIAWCELQRSSARHRVIKHCEEWLQWPLEGRLDFARYCREQFSEEVDLVQMSLYAELVAAPLISEVIWHYWLSGVPKIKLQEAVRRFLGDIANQPILVRLSKRLFVFASLKMFDELARELRHPDVTFSMIHEVMTPLALQHQNVYRGYHLVLDRALLLSSGALKKLIRHKADELMVNLKSAQA